MKGNKSGTPKIPTNMRNTEIRFRKIDNGYITQVSGMTGKGKNERYVSHESFSPGKPNISFGKK